MSIPPGEREIAVLQNHVDASDRVAYYEQLDV